MKKHNIKLNILMVITIMAVMFTACNNDDEYEKPNSFSDVGWYIGYAQANLPDTLLSNKDDYITFSDLSQNAISHTWEIDPGNFFLDHPIDRLDSIFDDKVIGSGSSSDKTVSVWFRQAGYQHVRLFNIFSEKVTFRAPDSEDNIEAEQVGDAWVIDKTFVVDVFDTIVPQIRVEQKGVTVNHESPTDTIFVEAGDTVEFFDETVIGRPNTWNWNIAGSTSDEQNPSIVFKKLGVFGGNVNMSRTGQNIPGDWDNYQIPAPFKVIPSSQPFVQLGNAVELEDETIQIFFNGEFAPFVAQESFFTVTVNGGANPVTINSVSINPDDATILEIRLNEPIYRPDVVTVSYDGNGTLESTDTRSPVAFTDIPVVMHGQTVIPADIASSIYDFEGPEAVTAWAARGDHGGAAFEISTERASSGNSSLKITGNGATIRLGCLEPVDLPAGELQIAFDVFIEETGTSNYNAAWPSVASPWFQQWRDLRASQGIPRGEWFTVITTNAYGGGVTATNPFFRFEGGANGVCYVDNFRFRTFEDRP